MNKLKYILLYLVFIFFVSCKTTSKVEKVSEIKSDTLYNKVETVITPPILSSLTINDICDSITNEPIKLKKQIIIDRDTVFVEIVDNDLQIRYNIAQGERKRLDSLYRVSQSEIKELKETKETKKVWSNWTWGFLLIIFIFIAFPTIPKLINSLLRKLIGLI